MKAAPRAGSLNIGERSVPRPSNSPSGSRPTSDTSVGKMSTSLKHPPTTKAHENPQKVVARSWRVRQASSEAHVVTCAMEGGGGEGPSLGEDVCLLPHGCGEPRAGDHEGNARCQLVVGLLLPLVVPARRNARPGSAACCCWLLAATTSTLHRLHSCHDCQERSRSSEPQDESVVLCLSASGLPWPAEGAG